MRAAPVDRPGNDRPAMDTLLNRIDAHPLSIKPIAPHMKDLTPEAICTDLAARLHQITVATSNAAAPKPINEASQNFNPSKAPLPKA